MHVTDTDLHLCAEIRPTIRPQLCQVVLDSGEPPEWVPLVPAGTDIKAHDGRKFSNSDPQGVVDRFLKDPRDLAIDYEHAGEIRAPEGKEAPAAGWVVAMEIRDGAIWGRVEWTPRGAESLRTREYRYISPAFRMAKKNHKVIELVSAGLTNRPALDMPSLAHDESISGAQHCDHPSMEEDSMDPRVLALLGLSAEATKEQVYSACKQSLVDLETARLAEAKAVKDCGEYRELCASADKELASMRESGGAPPLDKFVPRADHDAVVARAEGAEAKLETQSAEARQEKIDVAISDALKAGKITPASRKYHTEQCAQEGGLERFAEYVKAVPAVVADSSTKLDQKPDGGSKELTAEQHKIAETCGLTGKELEIFTSNVTARAQ